MNPNFHAPPTPPPLDIEWCALNSSQCSIYILQVFSFTPTDATIDLEEFIRYRRVVVKEREDRDLTPLEEEDEAIQFRAMDTDRTGTLSWWEFLNHESLRRLASKPQVYKESISKFLIVREARQKKTRSRFFSRHKSQFWGPNAFFRFSRFLFIYF